MGACDLVVGEPVVGEPVGDAVGEDVVGESVVGEPVGDPVGELVVGDSVEQYSSMNPEMSTPDGSHSPLERQASLCASTNQHCSFSFGHLKSFRACLKAENVNHAPPCFFHLC